MTPSETLVGVIEEPRRTTRFKLPSWLKNNPIILKEMSSRMRGWRSLVGLTGFVAMLSSVVALIYFSIVSVGNAVQIDVQHQLGRTIFFTVYGIELMMICMTAPAMTAGAISIEKEQQTYDLLRTTLLTARDLILGKLLAAISFVLLFMLAAIPLQSIAFVFGGLSIGEVVISVVIMILSALAFGALGIFFSSFISKTRISTGFSQITTVAIVILIPLVLLVAVIYFGNQPGASYISDLEQILLLSVIWLIGITSPAATALMTEVFLAESQSLFFVTQPLNSGATAYLPSPWLGFIVLYPILTFLLIYYSIRFVKRAESG